MGSEEALGEGQWARRSEAVSACPVRPYSSLPWPCPTKAPKPEHVPLTEALAQAREPGSQVLANVIANRTSGWGRGASPPGLLISEHTELAAGALEGAMRKAASWPG